MRLRAEAGQLGRLLVQQTNNLEIIHARVRTHFLIAAVFSELLKVVDSDHLTPHPGSKRDIGLGIVGPPDDDVLDKPRFDMGLLEGLLCRHPLPVGLLPNTASLLSKSPVPVPIFDHSSTSVNA